jgi:hypothetical protein
MRTIFLVLAAFLLTWIPMLVLALLEMIRHLGGLGSWTPPHWLYVFAMWSMCAGSVTYPILYGIYNRAIRKELRLCLSCSGGLNAKKWRNVNHFYHHGGSGHGGGGQRRGSKWSNYSGPFQHQSFISFHGRPSNIKVGTTNFCYCPSNFSRWIILFLCRIRSPAAERDFGGGNSGRFGGRGGGSSGQHGPARADGIADGLAGWNERHQRGQVDYASPEI